MGPLRPGDTVLVRGGTYVDPSGAGETWSGIPSGTATAPITIKAYPGETPMFDGALAVPQSFVLSHVSYVTFEGLAFTRYRPGVTGCSSSMRRTTSPCAPSTCTTTRGQAWTDHLVYIANGSSDVFIDGSNLDGITGAAVHIWSGNNVGSVRTTVQNSRLTNSGWGAIIETNANVATFRNNVFSGNSTAFRIQNTTGVAVTGNTIVGPIGIAIEQLPPAQVVTEGSNCYQSSSPFRYGSSSWTLTQWRTATGQGAGDIVGTCP